MTLLWAVKSFTGRHFGIQVAVVFASDFLVGAYVSFYFAESYIRHVKLSGNLLLGQAERLSHRRKFLAPGVLQPHGVPQRRVNLPGYESL